MKLLEGKTALITGANRGIGRAIALTFAKEGANIAFTDLAYDDNSKSLEEECQKLGVKARMYPSDASKSDQVEQAVKKILEDFGTINILVNNAGITRDTLLMSHYCKPGISIQFY
jgi:3-oxoacyl-[acyl-carrier protein] reductase